MGTPVLVDSDWLEAVDAYIRSRTDAPLPAPTDGGSRFYDVRPVQIDGEWSSSTVDGATIWRASAHFIINDVVDKSVKIDVYAPLATDAAASPTASGARVFVVWRGRWELLTGAQRGGAGVKAVFKEKVLKKQGVLNFVDVIPTGATTDLSYPETLRIRDADTSEILETLEIITGVGATDGKLTFDIRNIKTDIVNRTQKIVDPAASTPVAASLTSGVSVEVVKSVVLE